MEVCGLLSLKDFEGIHVDPTWSEFDKLQVAVEVATSKIKAQEKEEIKYKRKEANHSRMMRSSNKRRKLVMATLPMPPPDLPEELKERIKALGGSGTQVDLVIQKSLYDSDLRPNNNRLSMPFKQIINKQGFLREEERKDVAKRKAMTVPFIEPSGKCDEMTLKQWDMPKKTGKTSSTYVLVTHWNKVVQANGLGLNDVVQVWSFRVGPEQKLRLALVVASRSRGNGGGRDGGEGCSGSKC
jgi:hypothetical protein